MQIWHLKPGIGREMLLEINGFGKCSRNHLTWEVVKSCDVCILLHGVECWGPFFHILSKLSWPIAKIITWFLHHRDKNIIKVRVLEAMQTAEPILPILYLYPCVAKHSESHLALLEPEGNHALRRPVLSRRCFHLHLSWEFDNCRGHKQKSFHLQSQRAHPHLCLQTQPQWSAQMLLQQNARCGDSQSHFWCIGLPASIQKFDKLQMQALREVLRCPRRVSAVNRPPSAPLCN